MRAYFILLLAMVSLVVGAVPGPSSKLGNPKQFVAPADENTHSKRFLRTNMATDNVDSDDEERGVMDSVKKLVAGTKNWAKDKKLTAYVKYRALFTNTDESVEFLLKTGITPTQLRRKLGIDKKSDPLDELELFMKYEKAWNSRHGA